MHTIKEQTYCVLLSSALLTMYNFRTVQIRDFYPLKKRYIAGITLLTYYNGGFTLYPLNEIKVLFFLFWCDISLVIEFSHRNRDCIGHNFYLILGFTPNRRFLSHYRSHLEYKLEFEPFAYSFFAIFHL